MALLLVDFGVADKVPRGGCFDDVLGTEVSDVALTSFSGCVGACHPWMRASNLAQF